MSLARRGCDGSDVYVYEADEGYVCQDIGHYFVGTPAEMIAHLLMHRYEGGDRVPESTLAALARLEGVTTP